MKVGDIYAISDSRLFLRFSDGFLPEKRIPTNRYSAKITRTTAGCNRNGSLSLYVAGTTAANGSILDVTRYDSPVNNIVTRERGCLAVLLRNRLKCNRTKIAIFLIVMKNQELGNV